MTVRARMLRFLLAWRLLVVLGLGLLALRSLTGRLSAAETNLALPTLSLRAWRLEDGLPIETITALLQSRDGYLWIGTDEGLIRFDGVRFETFHNRNTPAFRLNRVSHLVESDDGDLWIAVSGGGVLRKRGPNYEHFGPAHGLSNEQVRALAVGRDGRIWAGTDGGGLFVRSGNRFRQIPPPNSDALFIVGVAEAPDGSAIVATPRSGIWRWDGTNWSRVPAEGLEGSTQWTVLQPGLEGRIWAGCQRGLWVYEQGRLHPAPGLGNSLGPVQGVLESSPGEVWLATQSELHHFLGGRTSRQQIGSGFSTRGSSILLQDREGSIWAATDGLGLAQLQRTKFTTIGQPEGLAHNEVTSTVEGRDGSVWLASAGGLNRITPTGIQKFTTANGLPDDFLFSAYEAPDGTLWLGTRTTGPVRYRDGKFSPFLMYGRRQPVAIWCISGDEAGNVWMGSTRGLHLVRPDLSVTTVTGTNGLSNDDVRSICKSPDGSLWVGTSYGLNLVRGNQVVTNWAAAEGHPIEIVVSLLAEPDGTIWIGTLDRGLFRYRDGRFSHYSATEGLPDSSVYQMIDDGLGSFWFSCGRGVFSVPKAELHAVADHRAPRFHANLYNRADGLRSLELTSSVQPAGMRTRDGRLWFPSNRGVAIIDPGHLPRNLVAPRPRIERAVLSGMGTNLVVRVQDLPDADWTVPAPERIDRSPDIRGTLPRIEIREPGAALELPPGGDFLELHFTAPTFVASRDLTFRCQLENFDRGWIDLGQRRVAYYTRVPPGRYTFRVSAMNHDGVASVADATLELVLRPHWWQGRWIPVALVGIVILAGLGTHRWRIAALERRRAAQETFARQLIDSQESERRRIASDLHDSLEQELLVIKNRADLALLDSSNAQAAQQQLSEISQLAMHAVEDVREITHDLRPKLLDRLGITLALRTLLDRISDGSALALDSDLDSIDGLLEPSNEINLYRIVQESLSNVLKHAQARSVHVRLSRLPNEVELTIRDDGRGFDPLQLDDAHAFGLRGLEERGRILGGRLVIQSRPGNGTTVLARFPITHRPTA